MTTTHPYPLANGAPNTQGYPSQAPPLPNQGRIVQSGPVRILCIADVRGNLKSLNDLAKQTNADIIIHTGDFGFYDIHSHDRIAEKTLRHVVQYSPLVAPHLKDSIAKSSPQQPIKPRFSSDQLPLSELPLLLNKQLVLDVPVYTVWGACEDVRVLEKFRSSEYSVPNLHIIDEANSRLLEVGGIRLRLFGLGGAVVMHKLFDNGEGKTTIAGGQGTMWTTLLQMGELIDTANRVYDPSETRLFVTHASPAREGILNQLSVALKADFSISAGLHFRYGSSYNEFSVNPTLDHYRGKLAASKASFNDVWDTVKSEVESALTSNEAHHSLLNLALGIVNQMPNAPSNGGPFGGNGSVAGNADVGQVDESAFKNMWNFNLADASFGCLTLEIEGGRIGTEMRAQGFNFSHRTAKPGLTPANHAATSAPRGQKPPAANPPSQVAQAPPQSPSYSTAPIPAVPSVPQATMAIRPAPQAQVPPPSDQTQKPAPVPSKTAVAPVPVVPVPQAEPATTSTNIAPSETVQPPPAAQTTAPTEQAQSVAHPSSSLATGTNGGSQSEGVDAKPHGPRGDKPHEPALYINYIDSEQAVRDLFTEDDRNKIIRIEPKGHAFVVYFSSQQEAREVQERAVAELLKHHGSQKPQTPTIRMFEKRTSQRNTQNWGRSGGNSHRGSHHSGSGASDTDGNRRNFNRSQGRHSGSERGSNNRGGRSSGGPGRSTKHSDPNMVPINPQSDAFPTATRPRSRAGSRPPPGAPSSSDVPPLPAAKSAAPS